MLNVRKLAAIDLEFLGARFILAEFGIGAAGSTALGALTIRAGLYRFHSPWLIIFGAYLIFLGMNYVPLLLHAISMVRDGSGHEEIAEDLANKQAAMRKYRRQSLFLLLPLIVPIVAIVQEVKRGRTALPEQQSRKLG